MSGFELEDEFIARTQKNLIAIEELAKSDGSVFEVTQLINSLLALLVFPREIFFDKIPSINKKMMIMKGWPLPDEEGNKVTNLRELIINMRNAVAHCNIELVNDGNEIIGIRFRNFSPYDSHREKPLWTGMYDVIALKKFVDMLLNHLQSSSRR